MPLVAAALGGVLLSLVISAVWGGVDLILGTATLTADRASGLLLVCVGLSVAVMVSVVAVHLLRNPY
jgi:hypothetical protein